MQRSTTSSHGRYLALDGLRGIAAILVVLYHFQSIYPGLAPASYLAVDFFFVLSGFVIAHAYEPRLRSSLTFGRFVLGRLIRLYPLLIIGLALGSIKAIGAIVLDYPDAMDPGTFATSLAFGLFTLPTPPVDPSLHDLFPINGPAWSLFFELIINAAFGLLLFRLPTRRLVPIAFAGLLLIYVYAIVAGSMNIGWNWTTFGGGLGRVAYSFCAGMVIARTVKPQPQNSWLVLTLLAILIAICIMPFTGAARLTVDLISVTIVFPVMVWMGALIEAPRSIHKACGYLGDISYPLYITHYPMISLITFVLNLIGIASPFIAAIDLAILLIITTALVRFYDAPLRSYLSSLARVRRSAQPELL